MQERLKIAVVFGGRSPEHDVSIVTGLQALQALDGQRFDAFPVYITVEGEWLVGDALRNRSAYIPNAADRAKLQRVSGPFTAPGARPVLRSLDKPMFGRARDLEFDVALLAFHGGSGEDGRLQGLFEVMDVPYTGMRHLACAVFMDKVATKRLLEGNGIPLLPFAELFRPEATRLVAREVLEEAVRRVGLPCVAKPTHLGSSIGVARVTSVDELEAVLPAIFKLDDTVMLEPYVANLVEYNVAVSAIDGAIRTSAIERPKRVEDLLDFRQKYLSGPGKSAGKALGQSSEGMLSLTRDINPPLPGTLESDIRRYASTAFRLVGAVGAPRIDFLCDSATGKIWLNEINPCPGSFGFFLWEAAERPILFTAFLSHLIDEALAAQRRHRLSGDPVPAEARLFKRP
jgi:D-alanine-D-alanine ligase